MDTKDQEEQPPEPRFVAALRLDLQELLAGELGVGELARIERIAGAAVALRGAFATGVDELLSRRFRKTYSPISVGGYEEDDGGAGTIAMAPSSPAETYGAKLMQEIFSAFKPAKPSRVAELTEALRAAFLAGADEETRAALLTELRAAAGVPGTATATNLTSEYLAAPEGSAS